MTLVSAFIRSKGLLPASDAMDTPAEVEAVRNKAGRRTPGKRGLLRRVEKAHARRAWSASSRATDHRHRACVERRTMLPRRAS